MIVLWTPEDIGPEKEIEMIRPQDFKKWVEEAPVGADTTYHQGTTVRTGNGGRTMTGQVAWEEALAGRVFLYRRRMSRRGVFEFRARRLSPQAGAVLRPHEMEPLR